MRKPTTDNRGKFAALGALVIVAAALAVHWPALSGAFIMDDDRYLTNNPLIASADGLYRIWCTNQLIDYLPLTYTSFWVEWRLWGMNPVGYHVTNLALHIATCLMLWALLRTLSIPGAFLAALIYAIHPVNVEVVACIAQRNALLAALFAILSVLSYVRAEEGRKTAEEERHRSGTAKPRIFAGWGLWYGLSLAAFLLAILSKISVASLPLALLLIVWWLHGRISKWDFLRTAPFFGIALALCVVQLSFQGHGDPLPHSSLAERFAGAGTVVWFYLGKALLPINQAFIYPRWHIHTGQWLWWLPLAAAIAVTLLLGWRARSSSAEWCRALFFAWAVGCVALAPAVGLIQNGFMVHSLVADRYQHLQIIAVIALAAAGWSYWRRSAGPHAAWPANMLAAFVVGALALLTFQHSTLFGDPISLHADCVEKNPESALAHANLSLCLSKAGKLQEALEHCRQAVQLKPDFPEAYRCLGLLLLDAHQPQQAIEALEQALRIKPGYPEALENLGVALREAGRQAEAVDRFNQALLLNPSYTDAHVNLGITLAQTGRLQEARMQFEQALRLKPDYDIAHNNLANVLRDTGATEEAIEHYRAALRLNPDYAVAYYNLGNLLRDTGRPEEASIEYQQFVRLKPDDASVYAILTKTYAALGRSEEAIATAQRALNLARAQSDEALAKKIDQWLTQYRAQQTHSSRPADAVESSQ